MKTSGLTSPCRMYAKASMRWSHKARNSSWPRKPWKNLAGRMPSAWPIFRAKWPPSESVPMMPAKGPRLHTDTIRNLENRINELLETETSRREEQATFLAQQAMALVERDRGWKDWQEKYEAFKQQAKNMEVQVVALDDSIRAAKRAQDTYNDLNQKLERRIAEVGEMQRLAEDRIRQEWVAFKAEEQKRWTSHSLSQEEAMRDLRKDMDKLEQRATVLDDAAQTLQDQLQQTTETTEKQLQELMNVANEWLVSYERIMGHGKKTKKAAR